METSRRQTAIAIACLIGTTLCFGSVPLFLRYFAEYVKPEKVDAWTVNAIRYSTAAIFWLPFVLVLNRRLRRDGVLDPTRSVWRAALVPAVINTVGQVGWALCPYFLGASTIAFGIRTSFLFTLLLGLGLIPAERLLARHGAFWIGAAASAAGIVIMSWGKLVEPSEAAARSRTLMGLAILLGTSLCWGGYAVSVRRYMTGYPLRLAFGVISLYTAGTLVVLRLLIRGVEVGPLALLHGWQWGLLIGSGLIGIAFAHVMYHRGIHGVGPVVANGVTLAGPLVTWTGARILWDEQMGLWPLAGGLIVIAGGVALVVAKGQASKAVE